LASKINSWGSPRGDADRIPRVAHWHGFDAGHGNPLGDAAAADRAAAPSGANRRRPAWSRSTIGSTVEKMIMTPDQPLLTAWIARR
jgi:hypothetical protein